MEKDTKWKTFFEDNHRYADIINGLGCDGRQLVSANDLQVEDGTSGKRSRDTLRRVAFDMNFVIVGIESQEEPDYGIPFRNMAYDVGVYGKQMMKIRREVRDELKSKKAAKTKQALEPGVSQEEGDLKSLMPGEYLYGFKKESRLHPVITFVLYCGEKSWDGARSFHDILDFTDVPESLKNMTPDYKVNIIDIRNFAHTEVFQTDVKQVFDFIRLSKDKEALLKLVESDDSYRHMEEDAFDVITTYTNSTELRKQMEQMQQEGMEKGEKKDMCKAIQDLMEDSREAGNEEGRRNMLIQMIHRFLSNGGTEEEAMRMLEVTREDIEAARKAV